MPLAPCGHLRSRAPALSAPVSSSKHHQAFGTVHGKAARRQPGGRMGRKRSRNAVAQEFMLAEGNEGMREDQGTKHPQKRHYRARAHSNPLNDTFFQVPATPAEVDWAAHYPSFFSSDRDSAGEAPQVSFADVGCGFGGLLVRLSNLYPDKLMLGMELRDKVSEYVKERIAALRREHAGQYGNISCVRTNTQKYLVHYFRKGQLTKLFFLFPDPHFKVANHRRRIISDTLLADYAYLLTPGGMLYTVTDVGELGQWMAARLDRHPLFERLSDDELADDKAAGLLTSATEEGQKVARNSGQTWRAVYRRVPG